MPKFPLFQGVGGQAETAHTVLLEGTILGDIVLYILGPKARKTPPHPDGTRSFLLACTPSSARATTKSVTGHID